MADPLLDLDTTDQYAAHITIDGIRYGLRHPAWLTLFENKRLFRLGRRYAELEDVESPTEAEQAEVADILKTQCGIVLDAPPEILEKLKDIQRLLVVNAFLDLPLKRPAAVPTATSTGQPQTEAPSLSAIGANSSPASVDSSEAIPAAG